MIGLLIWMNNCFSAHGRRSRRISIIHAILIVVFVLAISPRNDRLNVLSHKILVHETTDVPR
jgi:hypothetical protein